MTFLNPLVLFGLVAAGIPLLIHLFNFRRPRKVDFSSLVFLRELQETTMQRVKVKQWLLLLLRTLAIAALVVAFARPTLKGSVARVFGGDAESASVLVVDNSLSMTVRDLDGVLLDQAREAAQQLASLFHQGDQVAIIPTSGERTGVPRWLKTSAAMSGEIEALRPSGVTRSLGETIAEAGRLLESTTFPNREVFVLSDLQVTTLGDALEDFPVDMPVRLVKMGREEVANTAVTEVRIASQIVEPGRPIRIEATVASTGTESVSSTLASVFLDGDRSAQAEVQIPANGQTGVEFVVTPRRTGWLEGVVEIEDDAFPEDNRRHFAVVVPERRRVLVVGGERFQPTYISLALSAEVAPGRTRFDLDSATAASLSSRQLTDYDAVVLAGVSDMSSGQISTIESYVSGGGGLLLFPPAGTEVEGLNLLLDRLGGGVIVGIVARPVAEGPVAVIESADTEHPLFEGVFQADERGDTPRLEQLDVYRFATYRSRNAAEATLVRLSTGDAFLQEIPSGHGRVLFVASLPSPEWSELPLRGLFVPLMYRSLSYLAAGESPAGPMLTIGDRIDVVISRAAESDIFRIVGPQDEVVPEQRSSFGGMVLTVGEGIAVPGTYDVMTGDRLVRKLSANLDPAESDLRTLTGEDAAERMRGSGEADVRPLPVEGQDNMGIAAAVTTMRTGMELWNVFLGVALVILLTEMLVSRLWKPESASA